MKACPILAAAAIAGAIVAGGQVEIPAGLVACKGEKCQWWVSRSWCEIQAGGFMGPPIAGGWCRMAGEIRGNETGASS